MTSELRPCCDCMSENRKVVKTKRRTVYLKCLKCKTKSQEFNLNWLIFEAIMVNWDMPGSCLEQEE